jgi:D-serine deaminase-like pyridoxal phosphate-dependent protein
MNVNGLPTPCLLLDQDRFERNVSRLKSHLAPFAVTFRPHLKTAKSIEVARRVMRGQEGPAMVSTLLEAEYYASHGVRDLVYGVGIAPAKLDRVAEIRERHGMDVTVILDSLEQAEVVAAWCLQGRQVRQQQAESGAGGRLVNHSARLTAMIEVDCDGTRSGVAWTDTAGLGAIAQVLAAGGVELRGVMTHAGGSYGASNADELAAIAETERQAAAGAAEALRSTGLPCPIVSVGSTPTAYAARDLTGVDEVRAGVYMFGDLVQHGIGTCAVEDIAVSVLATVIGHRREKGWIMVDAGWMALSRDRGTRGQAVDWGYGLVCDVAGSPFPDLLVLDANQEHGIVGVRAGSGSRVPELPVGSVVRILPNHACATCAQHDAYQVVRGTEVQARWPRINGW